MSSIQNLITTCRHIVSHFRYSPLATARLKVIQIRIKLPANKLIQDVATRWNYTLEMMIRLVEQKQAILQYESEYPLEESLTPTQWRLMTKVIDVLDIFKVATLQISEANSLLSEILPTVKSLKKSILVACESDDAGVKTLKQQLLSSLERRFKEHKDEEKLLLATAVDPR